MDHSSVKTDLTFFDVYVQFFAVKIPKRLTFFEVIYEYLSFYYVMTQQLYQFGFILRF